MVIFIVRSSGDIVKKLVAENVHVKVIDDLAVGVEMHGVDCVLLGAEGVVETGGKFFLIVLDCTFGSTQKLIENYFTKKTKKNEAKSLESASS